MTHFSKKALIFAIEKLALFCAILALVTHSNGLMGGEIADRVVVAINSIPYSQLQIERYINVKESLRDNIQNSQTVQEANWPLAVEAFIEDMKIHQEATKSSGFRPTKEAIQRLRIKSDKNVSQSPTFKSSFERLGLNRADVETEILRLATVENYRRGKKSLDSEDKSSPTTWEQELSKRSIVRYLKDAKTWIKIEPKP